MDNINLFLSVGNYVRRWSMQGSQLNAEVLQDRGWDVITRRLAMVVCVTVPKVSVYLGVESVDFNSIKCC